MMLSTWSPRKLLHSLHTSSVVSQPPPAFGTMCSVLGGRVLSNGRLQKMQSGLSTGLPYCRLTGQHLRRHLDSDAFHLVSETEDKADEQDKQPF
jgi:hypothetical protein